MKVFCERCGNAHEESICCRESYADLPEAKRETNERSTYALLCDVCKDGDRRVAVTINNVNICHNCLEFFQNLAKQNNRTIQDEVYHQVDYIINTEGFANFA